jgi:hypothetical protein
MIPQLIVTALLRPALGIDPLGFSSMTNIQLCLPLKEPGNLAARMTIACAMATSTEDGDGTETTHKADTSPDETFRKIRFVLDKT